MAPASIEYTTPRALARRIAGSEAPIVIVDVRDHADHAAWRIEAPGIPLDVRNLPLDTVMRRLDALAAELPPGADVVIAGYVGHGHEPVAEGLARHGVRATVLAGGMAAWGRLLRPVRVRISLGPIKVIQVQRISRGCLAYLVICDREALVVDPGADVGGYAALAARYDADIVGVFETHLHGDHLSGARALARESGAELLVPEASLKLIKFADEVNVVSDGESIPLGSVRLRVLALPGHSADMTGLALADGALIAGDSLRADGLAWPEAAGDEARELALQLHATLHERLFALPPRTRLLPGHYAGGVRRAPVSPTIADARAHVPEVELPARAFAQRRPEVTAAELARVARIHDVNAGRVGGSHGLEAGAVHFG
jgi:glyoxylase-like metal-dependent hydrolase (beta-lactamase superfamily II)/rhodanese-related sulfurtransferase